MKPLQKSFKTQTEEQNRNPAALRAAILTPPRGALPTRCAALSTKQSPRCPLVRHDGAAVTLEAEGAQCANEGGPSCGLACRPSATPRGPGLQLVSLLLTCCAS